VLAVWTRATSTCASEILGEVVQVAVAVSSRRLNLLRLVFVFAAINSLQTNAQVIKSEKDIGRVPSDYFGMHSHKFHDQRVWAVRPDFGSWRLWGAGTEWRLLETEREKWDFRRLDFAVALARQQRAEVLLTLGGTPEWASIRPREPSGVGDGGAAPPRDVADWRRYVRTVVSRYRGRIAAYEIWNEPNTALFFSGSVDELLVLAKVAYETIKEIDPTAIVVFPSAAKLEGLTWLRQYLEVGGGRYADVIGYHFYTDSDDPEAVIDLVRRVQGLLAQYGLDRLPLWNTESGLNLSRPSRVGVTADSAHVARWLILLRAMGVERFYWYSLDEGNMGLVDNKTAQRRAAIDGWEVARALLLGASVDKCFVASVSVVCSLQTRRARQVVAWKRRPDYSVSSSEAISAAQKAGVDFNFRESVPSVDLAEMPRVIF
jgi:hypothetical protein